ncbi:MAG: NHLP family bacteriocin export ABC transporter peptidase/permease/ATPase subunit [Butyrivibrio sp.]|nr:NHLP family bacteriocin export ABC transporter peptidase/permease/ATPase subunit [Butyrivibrio sp.]
MSSKIRRPIGKGVARVPVVMQMEALECGAASLTMVMAYYNKWIPLEQVREDTGVSRDGAKAGNIARAARSYGMKAQGYRYEPEQLKAKATFPCIVHWNFNHFIVLKGFKNGKVYINDPARGDVTLSEKEFDEGFTGVCIMFEPGEDFMPSGKKKSMLSFAFKRLEGTGSAVAFVAITTSLAYLASIIMAGFSRFFMDHLLTGENPRLVAPFLAAMGVVVALKVVVDWICAVYSLRISGKFSSVGNATYFWHVLKLPMKFFSQRMAGDIEQRRRANATIAQTLIDTFVPLIINVWMLVFYLIILLRYSVPMTMVGVCSVIINIFVARYVSAKRVNITRVMMRDAAKLAATTVSGIEMIETIKASGAENGFFRKWSGYQASVNTQNVRYSRLDAYLGKIPQIIMTLVNNIILGMGVYLMIQGQFTSGMVLAFQGFLAQFLMPAQSLLNAGQRLQEMRTQMERIEDVMEYPEDEALIEEKENEEQQEGRHKLSGHLSLQHVTFGYSKLAKPLIQDFNLELKQGKSVAFVGGSGCGKSTLSKLVSGLYQPWEGEILFDGRPIRTIDREIFTSSVAVVNQDIIIFEDTIANNIKMWDGSIEDFEMIMAARDAHIHKDIMLREGGYQYKLLEGGRDFSGGQRQRLEIARVLAQEPSLIIMDEATSALDAQTEFEVVQSIRDRGITCIVIAHRLSTIRDCDEIIVLDHGVVVERGTHDELMAKGGMYTRLVTSE